MRDHIGVLRSPRVVYHQGERRRGRIDRGNAAEDVGRRHAAHRRGEADVPEGRLAAAAHQRRSCGGIQHVELAQRDRDRVAELLREDQRQVGRGSAQSSERPGPC